MGAAAFRYEINLELVERSLKNIKEANLEKQAFIV